MKKIFLFLTILMVPAFLSAQQTRLSRQLNEKLKNSKSNETVKVLIKGDIKEIKKIVEAEGGSIRYFSGNIASVNVPLKSLKRISENKAISRIETGFSKPVPLNDTMVINNNVKPVNLGQAPLSRPYTGKGVVFGMIDTGIDYTHPDFLDTAGKTRIKYFWDQSKPDSLNTPQPYGYGQEWVSQEIDSGWPHAYDTPFYGHGTGVASIAAGNGLAANKFAGVAPEADLVVVAMDFSNSTDAIIVDGVNYIFSKADSLGKPCVINISVGDYYGSHDGRDLQAQLIDSMITEKPGRVVVAACGNAGRDTFHLGYTVNADTNFTWFQNYGNPYIYFNVWADTSDFKNVKFSVGTDQFTPSFSFRGAIPFRDFLPSIDTTLSDTIYNGGNRIGIVETTSELIGGTYSLWIVIAADSLNYNWRFSTTGSGKFDLWSLPWLTGTSQMVINELPTAAELPEIIYYKIPDNDQTMVSSFQCSDNVITVGAYTNRDHYLDYNNNLYTDTTKVPGAFADFSSRGPTRDGRVKPDISASGDFVLSAHPLVFFPWLIANNPSNVAQGGFHVPKGGTSSASPIVAGIAALYLEKCPTATASDIKNAIINNPKTDSFTGASLPDKKWGYGKVDAYAALISDPCGLVGINEEEKIENTLSVYPNPFSNSTSIKYDFENSGNGEIKIFNLLGKEVKSISLENSSGEFILNRETLSSGIYFCRLTLNGKIIAANKLIIL
jgi:subtilisin family serine protease